VKRDIVVEKEERKRGMKIRKKYFVNCGLNSIYFEIDPVPMFFEHVSVLRALVYSLIVFPIRDFQLFKNALD
jgi:hypothetical protein